MKSLHLPVLRRLGVALLLSACCWSAQAAPVNVPGQPVLRIETGNHLGPITAISGDARGRYAVTVSEDKTARVWELASGQLSQVLRPPIGEESLGALYAVTMSPDGSTVAVAGNSAFDGSTHAVYLFDRQTGAIRNKGTITGMQAPVLKLSWSGDGRYLAVGLRQQGLRVFRTAPELGFEGEDVEFNDGVSGMDFSRDGRLVVAARDGALRLYRVGKGVQRLLRQRAPGGTPLSMVFSPDGQKIAVSYQENSRIDILDGNSLEVRNSLNYGGSGNLGRLVWSSDGRTLYAAGSANRSGRFVLLGFRNGGQGEAQELQSFGDVILGLSALPDGGVLAATGEPAWAALDASGNQRMQQTRQTADFRDAGDSFRVSADGQQIAFPLRVNGQEVMRFDLTKGAFQSGAGGDLQAAKQPGWGSSGPENWKNSRSPTLNGQRLPLEPGETSRSIALAGNGGFVLGTDWYVRSFDNAGRNLWTRRIGATAWAVNLSADGKWVVAGLADGSVRWYRQSDGQEQLAFFPHLDRDRWLVWTPPGYYDASVGGEALMGWQVNRAFNRQSDFFSVGRFRKQFYRPDVVQRVLSTQDVNLALQAANQAAGSIGGSGSAASSMASSAAVLTAQPPMVELQMDREVQTSNTQLPVRFAVRSPDNAPATEVKVRVNGKLVRSLSNLPRSRGNEPQVTEVMVPLPQQIKDAEVVLLAVNRNGVSDPTIIRVRRQAGTTASSEPLSKFKKLYLFAAGVARYANLPAENQLQYPAKDATEFAEMFRRHGANLYEDTQIMLLTDEKATKQNVLKGLQWIRDSVGPDDMGIIFLAGHGFLIPNSNNYVFAPTDLARSSMVETGVPGTAIQEVIANLRGRGIFFLDTCHSGFAISSLAVQNNINGLLNQAEDERGVTVISGAGGNQEALESDEWRNGAFTYAIKEGVLQRRADLERDGRITPQFLYSFVKKRMREMTQGVDVARKPVPKFIGASFDEPFIVVK